MVYLYTYNTSMSPFMQIIEMLCAFCETYPVVFFVPTPHVQLLALEMNHVPVSVLLISYRSVRPR